MTSAFKDYVNIQNSLKRLSYKAFLDTNRDMIEYHLEFSLMLDPGRFYGAEMQEESDDWIEYCSCNLNSNLV